jgi:hypothetical protein
MTPIGHLAVGFAAKRVVPRVPLAVLFIASWLPDVLFFVFAFAGLERERDAAPWSHGFLMSIMWSSLVGLISLGISLDLGLINRLGGWVIFVELALFVPAIASYIAFIRKNGKKKSGSAGAPDDKPIPIHTGEGSETHA